MDSPTRCRDCDYRRGADGQCGGTSTIYGCEDCDGVGIGYVTSVMPVYQSEVSAAVHRGWQVCCQPTTMLFRLILAYWINCRVYFINSAFQWRFPLLLQCVFAVYILALTVWLPDKLRWLIRHDGNEERGLVVLAKL